jgi:hypothetical protein
MKKFLLLICLGLLIFSAYANNGWRENEKEIKVYIKSQSEAKILHQLRLNGSIRSKNFAPTQVKR